MTAEREPMTCRRCWEAGAGNVHYVPEGAVGFNALAVETVSRWVCPVCGYNPGTVAL